MRNLIRFLGIIALVAAIGFSFAACGGEDDDDGFIITTTAEWNTALSQLSGKTGDYTLTIDGDIGVAGNYKNYSYTNTFGTTASGSLTVTLNGSGKLYLTSQGNLIYIGANQTLIIDSEDLTLEGLTKGVNGATQDNNNSVVYVSGDGTFMMNGGTISGNTNTGDIVNAEGGGVNVGSFSSSIDGGKTWITHNGTFMMYGGTISNNTSVSGGGVNVTGGTFTMYGGTISGNTAKRTFVGGGGVVIYGGTFRIVTGTIYGDETTLDTSLRNTAYDGAALYNNSTAQRGTFSGANGAWVSKGNLTTTDDTIDVLNGDNK